MLNLGTIFTVVLASLITSQHGSPLQSKDIEEVLDFLTRQKYGDAIKDKIEITSPDASSDDDSANNSIYGLLKNMEVIDLIEKANHENINSKSQKRYQKRTHKRINNPVYRNFEIDRHRDSETQQILEQLLQDTAHLKKQKHQSLTPNNLLDPNTLNDDNKQEQTDEGGDGLNEYSKIFVVLDPLAIQKSENKDALSKLVSKILSLSSSTNEKAHPERNKSHHYKGFRVKNNVLSRRYRRDSKETYGGRDSLEDDLKQKRSRSEHGGSGGRTAIPYIRQRGDIYEREH